MKSALENSAAARVVRMSVGLLKLVRRVVLALGGHAVAVAGLAIAPWFGDHAVLQRERRLPVWGTADAGETVTVTFGSQTVAATAGSDGRWTVWLDPLRGTATPAELVVTTRDATFVARDVVVGEVWLVAGQSNMEFPVSWLDDGERRLAAEELPLVRQLRINHAATATPVPGATSQGWQAGSGPTAEAFSAVGYFFAREIHRELNLPVGIVNASWGGTAIESWMDEGARAATPFADVIAARWRDSVSEASTSATPYLEQLAAWETAEHAARASHTKNPLQWPAPAGTPDSPNRPGGVFNAMIAPLQPLALRGILWYQGESNARRPGEYAALQCALIRSWREGWQDPALPFYFVQLPNYAMKNEPSGRKMAELREAQAAALALPHTAMAVAIDLGDPFDIHPMRKQEVARRLAAIARANLFGARVAWKAPVFAGTSVEGARMRARFTPAGASLVARSGPVQSLELAGEDRKFHAAIGEVCGDTLVVWSPEVPQPIAVRYAWTNSPVATLYGDAGLPVAPFRSDRW